MEFFNRFKHIYTESRLSASAAAFAYYILFSIFPVIGVANIFLSAFDETIYRFAALIPSFGGDILAMYTEYVSAYPGAKLLSAIMVAFLYMPFRAMKFVLKDIRKLYGIRNERGFVKGNVFVFVYTIVFIMVIAVAVAFAMVGSDLMNLIFIEEVNALIGFFVPMAVMFVLLMFLYKTATESGLRAVYKGALISAVLWGVGSGVFSIYVNNLSNYSIIYGSLGSLMAFLVWIYFTCFCVLLGTRVNLLFMIRNVQRFRDYDNSDL